MTGGQGRQQSVSAEPISIESDPSCKSIEGHSPPVHVPALTLIELTPSNAVVSLHMDPAGSDVPRPAAQLSSLKSSMVAPSHVAASDGPQMQSHTRESSVTG
jgi:hypothetical protein